MNEEGGHLCTVRGNHECLEEWNINFPLSCNVTVGNVPYS